MKKIDFTAISRAFTILALLISFIAGCFRDKADEEYIEELVDERLKELGLTETPDNDEEA